jgi:hypothetical protein
MLGVEPSNPGTARLSEGSMSEELKSAAKGGDVGVVRAILDRGNVNINGRDDRVTIFLFILFILFILFYLLVWMDCSS